MSSIYAIPGFSEPFSSLSHLLAAGIFAAMGVYLLYRGRGHHGRIFGLSVFIFSCVFLLAMSGVFHLLEPGGISRAVMQRMDHAAIFILIAGSFTPLHMMLFKGWRRWGFLLLIWSLAIIGITLKSIYFNELPEWLGLSLYLSLGWMGVISAVLMHLHYGVRFHFPLIAGAIAYTFGAVLDFMQYPTLISGIIGPHELFHIFVLFGIAFHWMLVHQVSSAHKAGGLFKSLGLNKLSVDYPKPVNEVA